VLVSLNYRNFGLKNPIPVATITRVDDTKTSYGYSSILAGELQNVTLDGVGFASNDCSAYSVALSAEKTNIDDKDCANSQSMANPECQQSELTSTRIVVSADLASCDGFLKATLTLTETGTVLNEAYIGQFVSVEDTGTTQPLLPIANQTVTIVGTGFTSSVMSDYEITFILCIDTNTGLVRDLWGCDPWDAGVSDPDYITRGICDFADQNNWNDDNFNLDTDCCACHAERGGGNMDTIVSDSLNNPIEPFDIDIGDSKQILYARVDLNGTGRDSGGNLFALVTYKGSKITENEIRVGLFMTLTRSTNIGLSYSNESTSVNVQGRGFVGVSSVSYSGYHNIDKFSAQFFYGTIDDTIRCEDSLITANAVRTPSAYTLEFDIVLPEVPGCSMIDYPYLYASVTYTHTEPDTGYVNVVTTAHEVVGTFGLVDLYGLPDEEDKVFTFGSTLRSGFNDTTITLEGTGFFSQNKTQYSIDIHDSGSGDVSTSSCSFTNLNPSRILPVDQHDGLEVSINVVRCQGAAQMYDTGYTTMVNEVIFAKYLNATLTYDQGIGLETTFTSLVGIFLDIVDTQISQIVPSGSNVWITLYGPGFDKESQFTNYVAEFQASGCSINSQFASLNADQKCRVSFENVNLSGCSGMCVCLFALFFSITPTHIHT